MFSRLSEFLRLIFCSCCCFVCIDSDAKKKDPHAYEDDPVNTSVSLRISRCFTATTIPLAGVYLSFSPAAPPCVSCFHHSGSLSLPPRPLNLLPQSVVLKGGALKRETTSSSSK